MDDYETILLGLPANYAPEDGGYAPLIHAAVTWAREHSRAIPAERVLGEGMVAVDRNALAAIEEKAAFVRRYPNTPPEYFRLEAIFKGGASEVLALIDALRANQGGADHD